MRNFLAEIIETKKAEIEKRKSLHKEVIFSEINNLKYDSKNSFKKCLKKQTRINCIGEIKKYSPSRGLLRENFDPIEIATIYSKLRLAAISVLTDEKYFHGKLEYLKQVKNVTPIPVLRKDFIIDPYQIYEAKIYGADAILLIVKLLSEKQLKEFINIAGSLSMDCMVEVHTEQEIEQAIQADAKVVGVNNRDLETFNTDINISLTLVNSIPDSCVKISESALKSCNDIKIIDQAGFDAVLIGERFMSSDDIEKTHMELFCKK
jgi:indole-3-glycerol phosphate synthase